MMLNPGVDGHTVLNPKSPGNYPKNTKKQPVEIQKNTKTELYAE